MRVVVDTNVFVSAALKDKSLPALAVHLIAQHGGLLKSAPTAQQLFEVLARPYFAPLIPPSTQEWLRNLLAGAEPVTIAERIAACRDPTDDKFLEVAVVVAAMRKLLANCFGVLKTGKPFDAAHAMPA